MKNKRCYVDQQISGLFNGQRKLCPVLFISLILLKATDLSIQAQIGYMIQEAVDGVAQDVLKVFLAI
jgi:hypothetical protein